MDEFDRKWDVDDRGGLVLRPVTRRRFLSLAGFAGLSGYFAASGLSVPEEFQLRTVESPQPTFDPSTYRLVVDDLVENPQSFTYQELFSLPATRQQCDFMCIERWFVNDVPWEGVQLGTLMTLAQPLAQAQFVTFHCLGGTYLESLSLEQAEMPSALLGYCMFGKLLPPEHGSPLRLVFPKMFGFKSAKWVTRVEFTAERDLGYWPGRFPDFVDPWREDQQPCSGSFEGPGCGPVGPVGGIAKNLDPNAVAGGRDLLRPGNMALTGLATGGALLLGASTWYAKRRLQQAQKRGDISPPSSRYRGD